jgi:diguanylate cyclase (GGDEF)-like protein
MKEQKLDLNKLLAENALLNNSTNEYKRFWDLLVEADNAMSSIIDIDKLIAFVVNTLAEIFRASRVSFMLLDEARGELSVKASRGLDPAASEAKLKLGEAFGGWVAKKGESLLVKNVEVEYPELSKDRLSRYASKSFVIVPIKIEGEVVGVLNLTDKKEQGTFTEEDLKMLTLVGRHLALHIENIRLLERNKDLATLDPLTNLFNHRYFQEHLSQEIDRAQRYRRPLSLIMLDIDDFQEYNENHGYAMGDRVLVQMAGIFKDSLRKVDIASRYAGEEFGIILPDTRRKQAAIVAEKLRDKIATSVFVEKRDSSLGMVRLTVSAGVAEYNIRSNKDEFIQQVKQAIQEAKEKGKNRVSVFK